jgi:Rha family phage regulatory protein
MDEILNLNLEFDENIGYFVSSRTLAVGLGKEHKHVLESLDNIRKNNRAEISTLLIQSEYKAKNGKVNREYKLTKDGFTLYMFHIQGFTEFKMAYINRFNEMESFIKEAHTKLKEIKIDKKSDWLINRVRTRLDQAEYLENQIAYLFEKLNEIYSKAEIELETKTKQVTSNFWDFKTPSDYDPAKEKLPVLYEVEIEKENLEEMEKLGINKDDALNDIVENKTLEKTVKILGQQKLTTKE